MDTTRLAALLGFLGVALGAFGAHGLERMVPTGLLETARDWWRTAALYHLLHAAAVLALRRPRPDVTAWLFTLGVAVFSGTLYAMALGAPRWFGAITPFGGVLLLAGWASLLRRPR